VDVEVNLSEQKEIFLWLLLKDNVEHKGNSQAQEYVFARLHFLCQLGFEENLTYLFLW
jgi:hypothetical protein